MPPPHVSSGTSPSMFHLTIDTGPPFSIELFAHMFGHPGISALEFAGSYQEEIAKPTLSLKGKETASYHIENTLTESVSASESTDTTELDSPQPVLQELGSQQRRRGTFLNHTPRNFEVRSSKRGDPVQSSTECYGHTQASPHSSSDESKAASWTQHWQTTPPKDWVTERTVDIDAIRPAELDSKEVDFYLIEKTSSQIQATTKVSVRSSSACDVVSPPPLTIPTTHQNRATSVTSSSRYSQNTGKRRRRQTPFKMSAPKPSLESRHSPLEPWVAKHRREASHATSSSVGDSAPKVEIDNVGEVSTFRAIQEYFESQSSIQSQEKPTPKRSIEPENIPLPSSPIEPVGPSLPEPTTVLPADDIETTQDQAPDLPERSPRRLKRPSLRLRSSSESSASSDFESAAQGQYSPYDKRNDDIHIPKRRGPGYIRVGQAERAGSSTLGRMAPPILGHEALTATAVLNDLSYYLKNTGPSPEPQDQLRKKAGLNLFKVGGKKSLAARVGSVEGSPQRQRPRPPRPACAREMTTSGGAKHLKIMIPSEDLVQDQTITLPEPVYGPDGTAKRVSVTWTEEMLNPLASTALENAISSFNSPLASSSLPVTGSKSPKNSPITRKPVPVREHPLLMTREEQTRARKLRDLRKSRKLKSRAGEDAIAGAQQETPALSRATTDVSAVDSVGEENEEAGLAFKVDILQKRVISLQRQNSELAETLARIVGFETEDGDLDAESVLKAYRQIKTGSGDSGYGQRSERVVTQ